MPRPEFSPARYFFRVLLWLPVFFVLWYYLAGVLMIVPAHLSEWVINLIRPGTVLKVEWINRELEYITSFTVTVADQLRTGNAVVTLNPLLYSWNIPVLLALCYSVSDKLFSNTRVILAVFALFPMHAGVWWPSFLSQYCFVWAIQLPRKLSCHSGSVIWPRSVISLV